jgi:hypothetical protein
MIQWCWVIGKSGAWYRLLVSDVVCICLWVSTSILEHSVSMRMNRWKELTLRITDFSFSTIRVHTSAQERINLPNRLGARGAAAASGNEVRTPRRRRGTKCVPYLPLTAQAASVKCKYWAASNMRTTYATTTNLRTVDDARHIFVGLLT